MAKLELQLRRQKLAQEQGWRCHWCKRPMTPTVPPSVKPKGSSCTLDHIFHRSDPRRRVPVKGQLRYVAACFLCNQKRGKEAEREAARQRGNAFARTELERNSYRPAGAGD